MLDCSDTCNGELKTSSKNYFRKNLGLDFLLLESNLKNKG
jgi:hypothetical protein